MVRGDVDMRAAQVPGERPLKPWRHPPIIGEHDDGARYRWRRCVANVELHQLPCSTPNFGWPEVDGAGRSQDFTAPDTCGVCEQFAAAYRCGERSDGRGQT